MFRGFNPKLMTSAFTDMKFTEETPHNNNSVKDVKTKINDTTTKIMEITFENTSIIHTHEYLKSIKKFSIKCPETVKPQNIGIYEIPTRRDLVLFTKRTLIKLFNNYHKKMLFLLRDIKEATRSTIEVENKCHYRGKILYRQCVKAVSRRCIAITKGLVATLERQEAEVSALIEDRVCDMTDMRTDPIELIKLLAMDEATSDFALPAFLRLLGGCSTHCITPSSPRDIRPRLRQMTDQDLVVKHFLTNKNYLQLIKDTKTYRTQNTNTQGKNPVSG